MKSAPKRSWFARHKILTALGSAVAVLVILGVIGSLAGPPSARNAAATPNAQPTESRPPPPAATTPSAPVSAAPAGPAPSAASDDAPGAIFAKDTWWDLHFRPGSVAQCQAEGEAPAGGTLRAWQLPNGGLACVDADSPDSPTWDGRITGADVYFPAHTDQQRALNIVVALLPGDATTTVTAQGSNSSSAPKPDGTCVEVGYSSPSLGRAISTSNSTWAQPDAASASLYTGHGTGDGSDSVYRATSVHEAIVTIGAPSPNLNC